MKKYWEKAAVRIALLVALATVAGAILLLSRKNETKPEEVSYSALVAAIDSGVVKSMEIMPGSRILAQRTDSTLPAMESAFPMAVDGDLLERAEAAGVEIQLKARSGGYGHIADTALSLVLILVLVVVLRSMMRGPHDVNTERATSTTTFADVAGADEVVAEVREIVDFLRDPDTFAALGARTPRGVLLSGPPGTGKTLIARAVAGEAGVPFFPIAASSVTGFVVGLGAHRIKTAFKKARRKGGVIFIDEIDALGGKRGRNSSHNEDDRTLNQLLVEMDGFNPRDGVIVIGATNRPDILDPALTRPGRFDRMIAVSNPTASEREQILRLHAKTREIPLADDVDLGRLARLLPGASGAELANLLNEAAITAGRRKAKVVTWADIEKARDRLLLGQERAALRVPANEWRLVAYHEAGHAIAGLLKCPEDGLHKVTIQARGRSLGVAHFSPRDDVALHSKRYLEGQLIKLLAGRAAEEIAVGPDMVTSGAESDFMQANRIARRMVMRLGMSSSESLLVADPEEFPLSAGAQERMEAEVETLLRTSMERAREVLRENRAALDALAAALIEKETLDAAEVNEIVRKASEAVAA